MRKRFEDLTPEQQEVISTWGQGQAVSAGAGTGKTTTLVLKCEALLKRKPNARFAAVSFTEKSASELKTRLTEYGVISKLKSDHWVTTIHGLCSHILREFPRASGLDGEETVLNAAEALLLWEETLEDLWIHPLSLEIEQALELLLNRETRVSLERLFKRVYDLEAFGIFEQLAQVQSQDTAALLRVAQHVISRYEKSKRRRGCLDFSDLEKRADLALKDAAIRSVYHQRFDLVLIDEFQDTNPVQAGILWKMIRPDQSNLCVVGDPKQSIYGFRDADVRIFDELCARLPVHQSLTWNFRSRPGVIAFTNAVCEDNFNFSKMHYEPLVARRTEGQECAPVIRLQLDNPQALVSWVEQQVAQGRKLEDIVLLLRKIRGNEHWIKPFVAAKIPVAIGSGGFFWSDPRVRELVAFLNWWDEPANNLSGAIFLRAPWVGIADVVLDQWIQQDSTWREPFLASDHSLARVLARFCDQVVRPGDLLLALLEDPQVEFQLGLTLLTLWHRAEEFSNAGLDFHSVIQEFKRATENQQREREIPPPEGSGQLRVLTIHASKGLEFPCVILVDFEGKWRAGEMPLLFWDRERGVHLGSRDEEGLRVGDADPIEAEFRKLEREKALCESKRLFYVALTRAKEQLVLACLPLEESDATQAKIEAAPYEYDHWNGWLKKADALVMHEKVHAEQPIASEFESKPREYRSQIGQRPMSISPKGVRESARMRARHSATEWRLLARCPRAYEWRYIHPKVLMPTESRSCGVKGGLKGKAQDIGTRIHRILQNESWHELKELEHSTGWNPRPLMQWVESSTLRPPSAEVWNELAFEVPIELSNGVQEMIAGSMDQVFVEKYNDTERYSIVDYKVTFQSRDPLSLIETYQSQLWIYAYALSVLEPRSSGQTSLTLVQLTDQEVHEIPVPLPNRPLRETLIIWAEASNRIIAEQQPAIPKPSPSCRYCEFLLHCDVGQQIV